MSQATQNTIALPINIVNARISGYSGWQQIWIRQGIIEAIMPMKTGCKEVLPTNLQVLDVYGCWVSLGALDLQINGGLGLAFPDLTPANSDKLTEICQYLWEQGVDGFLPTIVTTSVEKIQLTLSVLADFISRPHQQPTAQMLGVHLEGPFLNPQKRGAHPAEHLLPLTMDNVKRVLGDYGDIVKIITLAPELDSTGEVIPYLRSLGIIVSLGHSLATESQANQAFQLGASMVTHAFNAMLPLHHREPGLLGAALIHPDIYCGTIADGEHICPTMLQVLLRAGKCQESIFLVSDALAPIGLTDGIYPWDERQIEVKNGTARLLDGTLAGTTLPLLVGVQNLVRWGICDVENAIALATEAPRRALFSISARDSFNSAPTNVNTLPQKLEGSVVLPQEKGYNLCGMLGKPAAQLLRWQQHLLTGELIWQRLFR